VNSENRSSQQGFEMMCCHLILPSRCKGTLGFFHTNCKLPLRVEGILPVAVDTMLAASLCQPWHVPLFRFSRHLPFDYIWSLPPLGEWRFLVGLLMPVAIATMALKRGSQVARNSICWPPIEMPSHRCGWDRLQVAEQGM